MAILLALQFWEGDKQRAGELARFLASLEPTKNPRVDLLLSARWDCEVDKQVIQDCNRAFQTYHCRGRTQLTGHPMGSWALWKDTVEHVRRASADHRMPRYDCILTFEADCVPLVRGWADRLLAAWERTGGQRIAVGHEILPNTSPYPHLNGNLLLNGSAEMLDILSKYECPEKSAWDIPIYPLLKRYGGTSIPEMRSGIFFDVPKVWVTDAIEEGVVFVHGDKDGSVFRGAQAAMDGGQSGTSERLVRCDDHIASITSHGARELFGEGDFNHSTTSGGTLKWEGFDMLVGFDQHLYRFAEHQIILHGGGRQIPIQGLWKFPEPERDTIYTSPRLFESGGKAWLAYGTETTYPSRVALQHLALLDIPNGRVQLHADFGWTGCSTDINHPRLSVQARDWQFFHLGNRLCFVDNLEPFRVGYSDTKTRRETRNGAAAAWPRQWGTPIPSTPLTQIGDEWFGFFHSMGQDGKSFRGMVGAYACNWNGEDFINHRCSREPLLVGSAADGFRWPRRARYWEYPDVTATGARFDVATARWRLTLDVNHSRGFWLDIPHSEILASFKAAPIFQSRPIPRLPHRDGP